jgi:hypothetical protein
MIRQAIAAAVLAAGLFSVAPATATPLAAPSASGLLQHVPPVADTAQYRGNREYRRDHRGPYMRRHGPRPRYAPGARFRAPPPGYRRYGARPGNWRTRGCVTVGAIWFCP